MQPDVTAFHFSDDELSALLHGTDESSTLESLPESVAPSQELRVLSRQLAGQYVDVLASFISQAFAHVTISATSEQVHSTLHPLLRLADETGDIELGGRLRELKSMLESPPADTQRERTRYLKQLRAWLLSYATCLSGQSGRRLRELVDFGEQQPPLLRALEQIKGIGPRRLDRLYCAGLFTVDRVINADPEEIAQVTGLPIRLAEEVVARTHAFSTQERKRQAQELRRSVLTFTQSLRSLGAYDDPTMLEAAQETLAQLQQLIAQLKHQGD